MRQVLYIFTFTFIMLSLKALAQCPGCYFTIEKDKGCEAGELILKTSTSGEFIKWSTSDNQDFTIEDPTNEITLVKPTKKQTYVATVSMPSNNLLSNGNFDAGVVGFSTNYNHKSTTGGYYIGADIQLEVSADDDDGNISSVSYYDGNDLIGSSNTSPFSFTWTSVPEGLYFVRAEATDNDGLISSSSTVSILVGNAPTNTSPASLTKRGSGSSSQSISLGDPISDFYFEWTNASTVEVYGLPNGITANIDNTNKEISFSGTPTEPGTFHYTVITDGGTPETFKSGEFTISGTGNIAPTISIIQPYDGSDFNAGDFAIGTNPTDYSSNFVNKKDHTGNNGYMLVADGSNQPNTIVYSTTTTLEAGKSYIFNVWVSNIHKDFIDGTSTSINTPEIVIDINGVYHNMGEIPKDTAWHKLTINWTAPINSTTITIINANTDVDENDFALDDIGFYEEATVTDSITVSPCSTNIFSPDGDGQLDNYFIDGEGTAKIYNPGGTLIKELILPAYWDGRDMNGVLVNPGLYAVIINNTDFLQVTLVR